VRPTSLSVHLVDAEIVIPVPVDWVEDADSRVDIVSTALADLRGVARLAVHRSSGRQTGAPQRNPVLAP